MKRAALLGAALVLLVVAALLTREPAARRAERRNVEFPRYPRAHEIERQQRRSTLVVPPPAVADPSALADAPAPPDPKQAERLDPLHVALAEQDAAIVIEASALKDSPLGRMLLACLSPDQLQGLEQLEREMGFRPLEQIDRIAIGMTPDGAQPLMMLDGDFASFDPAALEKRGAGALRFEPYGARAQLAMREEMAIGAWNDKLLVVGEVETVRGALGRLEGDEPMLVSNVAGEAYGDVYGTISGRAASRLVPEELRQRLGDTADRISLHVDASDDLLLVAQVYGDKPDPLRDLATSIGGALALGRLHAVRENEPMLSDLLEQSRVIPDDGSFQIEMALPLDTIRKQLGDCAREAAP